MIKKTLLRSLTLFLIVSLLISCAVAPSQNHIATMRVTGSSELYVAIRSDDLDKVRQLVSSGEDIDKVLIERAGSKSNISALSAATYMVIRYGVTEKRKAIVRYLLEHGADVNEYKNSTLKNMDKSGALAKLFKPYRAGNRGGRVRKIAKKTEYTSGKTSSYRKEAITNNASESRYDVRQRNKRTIISKKNNSGITDDQYRIEACKRTINEMEHKLQKITYEIKKQDCEGLSDVDDIDHTGTIYESLKYRVSEMQPRRNGSK